MTDITFTQDDLATCIDQECRGKHKTKREAYTRHADRFVWPLSNGIIDRDSLNLIFDRAYEHYTSFSSREKVYLLVTDLLEFLEDEKGYDLKKYLKIVKGYKPKKPRKLNKFNVDDCDILNLINHIKNNPKPLADPQQAITQALFLAFTRMRQETSDRLRVKDIRAALDLAPYPSLFVNSDIDKTCVEHYVPIHPALVPLLEEIITGKDDEAKIFDSKRLYTFLYNHPLPCADKQTGNFQPRFLRKYFTQKSDQISMDRDLSDYIQSHNMSSVLWESYKNYTCEEIYNKYISAWGSVDLLEGPKPDTQTIDLHADDYEIGPDDLVCCDQDGILIEEEEDLSSLSTDEILTRLYAILEESQDLVDMIRTYNRGRADPITVPNELPTSETIRLWLRSEANKLANEGEITQEEIDECKHDTALSYYHKYLDQYKDLMVQSDNRGILMSEIVYDSHTLIV